jgi:hypothetical protein
MSKGLLTAKVAKKTRKGRKESLRRQQWELAYEIFLRSLRVFFAPFAVSF